MYIFKRPDAKLNQPDFPTISETHPSTGLLHAPIRRYLHVIHAVKMFSAKHTEFFGPGIA